MTKMVKHCNLLFRCITLSEQLFVAVISQQEDENKDRKSSSSKSRSLLTGSSSSNSLPNAKVQQLAILSTWVIVPKTE